MSRLSVNSRCLCIQATKHLSDQLLRWITLEEKIYNQNQTQFYERVIEACCARRPSAAALVSLGAPLVTAMPLKLAIPVLRVTDVARSIDWYHRTLAFVGDPFPATPPFQFAILRQEEVELMPRLGAPPARTRPRPYDWDVYLRREGDRFREVFAVFSAQGIVTRRLKRMFYGLAEFEIIVPDGKSFVSVNSLKTPPICLRQQPRRATQRTPDHSTSMAESLVRLVPVSRCR